MAFQIEQIVLRKIRMPLVHFFETSFGRTYEREMVLVKIHAPSANRPEIVALAGVFDAKIVDVGYNTMIIEMTGTPSKVENFVEVIRPFGVKEMMRTGRIAMVRGVHTHQAPADAAEHGNGHVAAEAILN